MPQKKKSIDFDKYSKPSGRTAEEIDTYFKGLRDNDRQLIQFKEIKCITMDELKKATDNEAVALRKFSTRYSFFVVEQFYILFLLSATAPFLKMRGN